MIMKMSFFKYDYIQWPKSTHITCLTGALKVLRRSGPVIWIFNSIRWFIRTKLFIMQLLLLSFYLLDGMTKSYSWYTRSAVEFDTCWIRWERERERICSNYSPSENSEVIPNAQTRIRIETCTNSRLYPRIHGSKNTTLQF